MQLTWWLLFALSLPRQHLSEQTHPDHGRTVKFTSGSFRPIGSFGSSDMILVGHPDRPFNTLLSQCVITMADEALRSLVAMDGCTVVGLLTFRDVMLVLVLRQKEQRCVPTPPATELKVRDVLNSTRSTQRPKSS